MTTPMDTRPVGSAEAAAIEAVEARAWADLVAAAPAGYAARIGLAAERAGDAIVVHCAGGGFDRGLFNRPIGLGVVAPATRDAVRDIVAGFRRSGATRFMLVSQPHCRPAEYERWLADEGLLQRGAWDRVVRDGAPGRCRHGAREPPDHRLPRRRRLRGRLERLPVERVRGRRRALAPRRP